MNLLLSLALLLLGVLAWWNFRTAVTLVAGLIPAYLLRTSIGGIPTTAWELCVIVLVGVSILRPELRSRWQTLYRRLPRDILVAVAFFVGAAIVGTLISDELRVSLGILKGWVVVPLLFAATVAMTLENLADRARVTRALLWSGVVMALVGLWQVPDHERITGLYDVPNSLALWLAPLLTLSVWQALATRTIWYWLVSGILAAALLFTQVVGGIAAVFIALLLMLLRLPASPQRQRGLFLLGLSVIVSLVFLYSSGRLDYLVMPLKSGEANSVSVRRQLWSVGAELIWEQPMWGIGLGQFEPHYQFKLHERFAQYAQDPSGPRRPLPEFVFRDPHNWVLSFWLNVGLIGLVSFAYLQVRVLWSLFKRTSQPELTQGIQWALIALLLFGLVDTIYWKNDLAALQWLWLLLLI